MPKKADSIQTRDANILESTKRCLNCMRDMDGFDVCRHCGWHEQATPHIAGHLPHRHLLADRYFVGVSFAWTRYMVYYRAFDTSCEQPVTIAEYLPVDLVRRVDSDTDVQPESPEADQVFRTNKLRLMRAARMLGRHSDGTSMFHVLDCQEVYHTVYVIFESVQGQTLRQYLDSNMFPLPVPQSIAWVKAICDISATINKAKCSGSQLETDRIYVIAGTQLKAIPPLEQLVVSEPNSGSRIQGVTAPEGKPACNRKGQRALVYALGAMFYRFLTGHWPQDARDRCLTEKIVTPSHLRSSLPPGLDAVVMRCLALNPTHRYRSAHSLRRRLDRNMDRKPKQPDLVLPVLSALLSCMIIVAGLVIAFGFGG